MRVHLFANKFRHGLARSRCGRIFLESQAEAGRYLTSVGHHIEMTDTIKKATCVMCRRYEEKRHGEG